MKRAQKNKKKKQGGFDYYRTTEQILEYMQVPTERKLKWLEEMRRFNRGIAEANPLTAEIQEKFRRGEI